MRDTWQNDRAMERLDEWLTTDPRDIEEAPLSAMDEDEPLDFDEWYEDHRERD